MRTDYTRQELIDICEKAIVPEKNWRNRDSESAQKNVGRVWQLLKCGCNYHIHTPDKDPKHHGDEDTIIISFTVHNFQWFENGGDLDTENENEAYTYDSSGDWLSFYIPTPERLSKSDGKDWY